MSASRAATVLRSGLSAAIAVLACAMSAQAAAPVKLVLSAHIGWEVDKGTLGKVCTVASKHECQPGAPNGQAGGFEYPEGVAGAPGGNIYVADQANHRVQELTDTGEFVLMFGKEVNATTHTDICTEEEIKTKAVKCKPGTVGTLIDALSEPQSITVDPSTTNVYVQDYANWRVDEYTAGGQFILTIGKEVDETKVNAVKAKGGTPSQAELEEENVCTAASKDSCKAGVQSTPESTEKGAFDFAQNPGDLLAIGGAPEHLLYVGDAHRIQKFDAEGKSKGEIQLPLAVIATASNRWITAVAVSASTVYAVYDAESVVREFNASTGIEEQSKNLEVGHGIIAIALDASGHLAVAEPGSLYRAEDGHLITRFAFPAGASSQGIGFNGKGELYAVIPSSHEVLYYIPKAVGELTTGAAICEAGPEVETSATFNCTLKGEIDPWGVKETSAWFEWGRGLQVGEVTKPPVLVANEAGKVEGEKETPTNISAPITGLRPNEKFYDRLTAEDQNVKSPETLTGETESFTTPGAAPKIPGEPSASFVSASSTVLFGEVNPENTTTEYYFEYGPLKNLEECAGGKNCLGIAGTPVLESAVYGRVGTTAEITSLQPETVYGYRLTANNQSGGAPGAIGKFTTGPSPVVQAETGTASMVSATGAILSGSVNPDGQPAAYTFEIGAYEGANTRYAIVFSGSVETSTVPVAETFALTGLQPHTTYAFRIEIHSGYGTALGAPATFTTTGPSQVLLVPLTPPQLAIPPIGFPKESSKNTRKLTQAQQLARALKACAKKPKKERATCRRNAHKKYPLTKSKTK